MPLHSRKDSRLPHRANSGRWGLVPLPERKAPPKRGKDHPGKENQDEATATNTQIAAVLRLAAEVKARPDQAASSGRNGAAPLHREIFLGGGNLTNSSPGRNRSGSSLGTPECGLNTTLASGAGGGVARGAG